ncbi:MULTISPECIES: YgaP-like transmembrane domain [Pseudomonas]|uniref:YgaP-like transmembrane domain n=1 Tax=Pseudomonas TaxID=286 RepID=UPI001CE46896|nr:MULTISPECIES: YgaP-like transmembrane domain [Pseudomonas]MCO7597392.1 DUF2892 domain-containing protein [Pseudomonas guariconensis]MCO7633429.1 DUF2892 domain-containing protein [Pseudomonas guariconensis]MCU7222258.1 DUF2892 domain-containing protein [Pseudomonas brassicacearum]
MLDIHSPSLSRDHNVHGWERASSLAGGALMISKGLRHGGLLGLLQVAVGGMALARGISGHCSTKAWWQRQRAEYHRLRDDIERSAAELKAIEARAEAAAQTVAKP